MPFARTAAAVLWKDLRVELRARDAALSMLFFAAIVVMLCSLAFVRDGRPVGPVASGILWIAIAFSGVLGLGRQMEREREGNTMAALLLSPAERAALLLGKALSLTFLLLLTALPTLLFVAMLFNAPLSGRLLPLSLLLLFGCFGFALLGSVFGTLLYGSRARELLLAIVIYPLSVPTLIGGTVGTTALFDMRADLGQAWFWVRGLGAFDLIFLAVALWAYGPLTTE